MNLTLAILLLYFCTVSAQQKPVETIYFEFDRFDLTDKQIHVVSDFAPKTVFHYLISKKISKTRMTYVGCGNKYPLGKGDKYDRRVEFKLLRFRFIFRFFKT